MGERHHHQDDLHDVADQRHTLRTAPLLGITLQVSRTCSWCVAHSMENESCPKRASVYREVLHAAFMQRTHIHCT